MHDKKVMIQDLGMIGDRRTCAMIDKGGNIVWYCPRRFDEPSFFASLLDAGQGGAWRMNLPGMQFQKRAYLEDSGLLQTYFVAETDSLVLEDWMPLYGSFYGICRTASKAPVPYRMEIDVRPNYNRQPALPDLKDTRHVVVAYDYHVYASHPLHLEEGMIVCAVPAGEAAWFVLSERALDKPETRLRESRELTLENWREIAGHITYTGPYADAVSKSLRLLRMLTYAQNGGIIAAATTSLPEVLGGKRNYDYRYVWLRDAAMIVSALARAGSDGEEERKFLSFICSAMHRIPEPVVPMLTLDEQPAGMEQAVDFEGYKNSTPVRYGNGANSQLQLDANSNVIIAAKVIYNRYNTREHWETVQAMADFLVENWDKPDHGIWEETEKHQYSSSKVVAAVSLEYIADHSEDEAEKKRWLETAARIRQYVADNCITSDGAYAVYAGSEAVDVSAVLFPIWGFTDADTPQMLKTMARLEQEYSQNNLYRRHLVEFDSRKEGAFLAGTFWVAQYWVMRGNREKVEQILEAALRFMNDVGLMPEEGDPETGEFLGNIPQSFVHASLIGAVIDYKTAFAENE
ncbi:glycoside hydrolase family 15 protein [Pontibacter sp. E15-1]|uniref:glycoside hydrolase family 15 protein n=1 Tax=Pontibacter sp. E15-1 TaxID=2919918 RepID=UPI001F501CF1|nr:glycoside hydrolase family 15 protein [Pontibacter sp. E15-1]MCJ8163204.1 glycoside hydrolase family 15 protein [Pontibacter sp. E15-1]